MNVIIEHLTGSKTGRCEKFDRDTVLIGRGRANDVILDPFLDGTVSTQHAEIRQENSGFFLYDMGSLNGTYLNGINVRRAAITNGDEIGLGQQGPRLCFETKGSGDLKKSSGFVRAVKQLQLSPRNATSSESAIPRLEERIVSRNKLIYIALALVIAAISYFLWRSYS